MRNQGTALAEVSIAQTKRFRRTEEVESKGLLGTAVMSHAPTPPPASARIQAKEPNSAAVAAQAERFRVSVRGNSNATKVYSPDPGEYEKNVL